MLSQNDTQIHVESSDQETKETIDETQLNINNSQNKMLGNLGIQITRTSIHQLEAKQCKDTYRIMAGKGEGKYGMVYKAHVLHRPEELVALKKIKQDKEANGFPRTALREIHLLSQMNHKNIIQFKEVVVEGKTTYIALEYMDTDLQSLQQKYKVTFTEPQMRYLMYQVLDALCYLHSKNVYHRDIKPNNILYNNQGQVKICDFGMANEYQKSRPQTKRVYIPQFRAPEIYLGQKYDCSVDVWAAGILFVQLYMKQNPFAIANSDSQCFRKILEIFGTPNEGVQTLPFYRALIVDTKYKFPRTIIQLLYSQSKSANPLMIDLIDRMLTLNPEKRITAQDALKHPYFSGQIFVHMPRIQLDDGFNENSVNETKKKVQTQTAYQNKPFKKVM